MQNRCRGGAEEQVIVQVQRLFCRGFAAAVVLMFSRGGAQQGVGAVVQVQRCRCRGAGADGAELQRCRGAEVQRCRGGAEV